MASLIRANPSVISGHRVNIDDKTNQTANERFRSPDWREYSCNQLLALSLRSNDSEMCAECISAGMQSDWSARHTKPEIDDYVTAS